jgi:hypothetical protein
VYGRGIVILRPKLYRFSLTFQGRSGRLNVGGGSSVHKEYLVDDAVAQAPAQVRATVAAFEELQRRGGSPLLKALSQHFHTYSGLTEPAEPKDTASGNLV